jgi:hypothetical protein
MVRILICLLVALLTAGTAIGQDTATGKKQNAKKISAGAKAQDAATDKKQAAKETSDKAKARETATDKYQDAKEMSGMSIVGNDEAPKSLYIVPWKSSEIGVETSLNTLLNEGDMPVDRDVFKRQLEFYKLSTAK